MRTKYKIQTFFTGLSILMISACGQADTADSNRVNLSTDTGKTGIVMLIDSQLEQTNTLITSEKLDLTTAKACIEEIELKLPPNRSCDEVVSQPGVKCELDDDNDDSPELEIKIKGPFEFNLLTGKSQPSLENIQIPQGQYTEIEFEFDNLCGFSNQSSIVLEGSANHQENTYPFLMEIEFDDDLEIENPSSVEILESKANQIFTSIVLEKWFAQADWIACIEQGHIQTNENGVYHFYEEMNAADSCDEIYDDIEDGIEDALDFD